MILSYSLFTVICLSTCLILLMPARYIIQPIFQQPALISWTHITSTGTIWQGTLKANSPLDLTLNIHWQIKPLHIFNSKSVFHLNASTPLSNLTLYTDFKGFKPTLRARAQINNTELNQHIKLPQNTQLSGQLTIKDAYIENNPPYYLKTATAYWSGGVIYADKQKYGPLPALDIIVNNNKPKTVTINITEKNSTLNLIDIHAAQNKIAEFNIYQRLLTLLHQEKLSEQDSERVIRFTETLIF